MGSSVDNRIVILTFDNKNFETNANESIKTLDKLKKGLKLDESSKGLDSLSKKAKTFNLDGMNDAIDSVNHRFSSLGVVGATVLSELTKTAMNLGGKLISGLTEPLVKGGWNRALNIEQAKFQLEGLGVDFKKVTDDINYGVKDTAYGFDAAAKAASQLSASGIQVGEEMKYSLRGISGVAAMTSSSYEEIAQIFARVAGQGRVMAVDLNSIAARGLNAAAALAKALGTTEEEVRDMVRHGQIDFRTFAQAMDDAFGEHAKDANKTFSGAMANVKAALSRIGADVAANSLTNLRDIFNSLRLLIDNVHEALGPLIDRINKLATAVSGKLIKFINFLNSKTPAAKKNTKEVQAAISELATHGFKDFDKLAKAFDVTEAELKDMVDGGRVKLDKFISVMDETFGTNVTSILDKFRKKETETKETTEETAEAIISSSEDIEAMARRVWAGEFGNGVEHRREQLEALGYSFELVQNKVNELVGCDFRYEVSAEAMAEASEDAAEGVDELSESVDWLNTKQKETKLSNIQIALKNLGSAAKTIGRTFVDSFKEVFSKNSFAKDFQRLGKNFKDLTNQFVLNEDASRGLSVIWKGLFTFIKGFIKGLGWVVTAFMKVGQAIAFVVRKIIEFVGRFDKWLDDTGRKSRILSALGGVIRKVGEIIVAFKNKVVEVAKAIAKTEGFQIFVKAMKALWEVIKNVVGRIIDSVISGMERFGKWKPNFSWMDRLVEIFGKVFGAIGKFILAVINGEHPVRNFFNRLSQGNSVGAKFLRFLKTIGGGIANFVKKLKLPDKAKNLFAVIKDALLGGFEKLKSSDFLKSIVDFFKNAWDKLKDLDWEKLTKIALKAVAFIEAIRYINSLIKLNKNVKFKFNFQFNLAKAFKELKRRDFAAKARDFAIGVGIIAGALYVISKIKEEDLERSVKVLIGIIGGLAGVTILMDKLKIGGTGFAKFAFSMVPLGIGLMLLAGAMKIFAMMKPETFKKGATAIFETVIVLALAARLAGKGSFGAFAGIALMLLLLVPAIGILGKMKTKTIKQGVKTIAEVVFILAIASRIAGRSSFGTLVGMGLAVDMLVPALWILGRMDSRNIKKGVNTIMSVAITLGVATRIAGKSSFGTFMGMAAVILVVTAALKVLAKSDPKTMLTAAISLGGVIMAVGISLRLLKRMDSKTMLKRVLAMSILIGVLAAAFAVLAYMKADKVLEQAIGMGIVIVAIAASMKLLKNMQGKAMLKKVLPLVIIIGALAGAFALLAHMNADKALTQGIAMGIVVIAISAALKILSKVDTKKMLVKIIGFAAMLYAMVGAFAILSKVDTTGILEQATAMSEMAIALSGALWILAKIKDIKFTEALKVIGIFDIFVFDLAGVLAGLGALTKIPHFEELVSAGAGIFGKIGDGIGLFVGGIVGGIQEGISSHMPAIGENLSTFAENIKPFIDIVGGLDDSVLGKMDLLSDIVMSMSAATMMDGLGKLFSFGKDPYEEVGTGLVTFASKMEEFSTAIAEANINTEDVKAVASAATAIAEFAQVIPNSGGLLGKIVGNNDMKDWAPQLEDFADGMIAFSSKIRGNFSDQTVEDIKKAVAAGTALAEMADSIPNEGLSFMSILVGDNDLKTWSEELTLFADGIIEFSHKVQGNFSDASVENINKAVAAGAAIASMADEIPNGGLSVLGAIIGDNDLGLWSSELPLFADGIVAFANSVRGNFSDQTVAYIEKAVAAGAALANMSKEIPNGGASVASFFVGDNDLGQWSTDIALFGNGIVAFAAAVRGNFSEQTVEQIDKAIAAGASLAEMSTAIPDSKKLFGFFGNSDLSAFSSDLPTFGQAMADFSSKLSGGNFDADTTDAAINVAQMVAGFYSELSGVIEDKGFFDAFKLGPLATFGGELSLFGDKLVEFNEKIKGTNVDSTVSVMTAISPTLELAVEINKTPYDNFKDFGKALTDFGDNLKDYGKSIDDIDTDNMVSVIENLDPLFTLSKSINGISYDNLSAFVKNLGDFGANLKDFGSTASSLNFGSISQTIATVYDLINMAVQMRVVDPSVMTNFGQGLANCANNGIKGFTNAFTNGTTIGAAKRAAGKMVNAAYNGAKSANTKGDWWLIGVNFAKGLIEAFEDYNQPVYDSAKKMVGRAIEAALDVTEEASPSKAMYRIGSYAGEGLVIGLDSMNSKVYNAGANMATAAMSALQDPMSAIQNLINSDDDLKPVITPILDLSEFNPNAQALGQMFGNRSFNINGLYGLTYSGINARDIANDINKSNVHSNKDVVDAILSMKDEIDYLGEAITGMQIRLDGKKLVGELVEPIDSALWDRMRMAERGVY